MYDSSIWKKYFPIYTKHLKIETTTNDCNYLLLTYILMKEQKGNHDKRQLQQMLSTAYERSSLDFTVKLKHEGKYIRSKEDLLTQVMEVTYSLTWTDMMVLCDTYKIPVAFCRAKNIKGSKKKNIEFYRTDNMSKKNYYYYIRVIDKTKTNDAHFDLFYYRNSGMRIDDKYIFNKQEETEAMARERKRLHHSINPINMNEYIRIDI